MNLYVRYYEGEAIVSSIDELMDCLKEFGVPDTLFDDDFVDEVYDFIDSKAVHPRRFKVTQRQYFILIKTNVETLEQFKANANKEGSATKAAKGDRLSQLTEVNPGWYDCTLIFKRVIYSEQQNKFQYNDTTFRAKVKAETAMDCYKRIVDHLKNRQEIDPRSQFPSAKGHNFTFTFLGETPYVD